VYKRYIENTYITKNWPKLENNNKPLIFKKRHFHVFRKHERVLNSFFLLFFIFFIRVGVLFWNPLKLHLLNLGDLFLDWSAALAAGLRGILGVARVHSVFLKSSQIFCNPHQYRIPCFLTLF